MFPVKLLVCSIVAVLCCNTLYAQIDTVEIGQVPCGEHKDTMLTLFNNTPDSQVLVGMDLSDVAAGDYQVVTFPQGQSLPPGSSFSVVVRCTPSFPVRRRAMLRGVLNNNGITSHTNAKVLFSVATNSSVIANEISLVTTDSRPVSGRLVVQNPTKDPIIISGIQTVNPPISSINTTLPLTIPPRDSVSITLLFTPTSISEFFTQIELTFSTCTIKSAFRVFCKNTRSLPKVKNVVLTAAPVLAPIGEVATLQITRTVPLTPFDTEVAVELEIEVAPAFIAPDHALDIISTSAGVSIYRVLLHLPAEASTPVPLAFRTALGADSIATVKSISGIIRDVDSSQARLVPTSVAVSGFCEAGGKRLISSGNKLALGIPSPNPANTITHIEISTLLRGQATVTVLNPTGEVVHTHVVESHIPGTTKYQLNTSSLPTGLYSIILWNEGMVAQQPLVVIR